MPETKSPVAKTLQLYANSFIEYFPAFALLFCAVSWGRGICDSRLWRWVRVGGLFTLVLFTSATLVDVYQTAQEAESPEYMAGAANWLQQNTSPGTLVFQTDGDDFPYLFYHNTSNIYLIGLDPTFLERANPPLWKQWVDITRGWVIRPSQVIQDSFGASYVVSDRQHDDFEARARDDPNMLIVYSDRYSYVWRILGTA